MSHRISQNLKGALGEIFVKRELKEFKLIEPFGHINGFDDPPKVKVFYPVGEEYIDYMSKEYQQWADNRYNKLIEKYGTCTFPDFFVKDTKIFLEVKTGKGAKLEKNQIEEFPKILEKGFRIFIIRPRLLIEERKFEVTDFYCTEFLGRNKRIKITLNELKQLIRKEVEK